MVGWHHELNDHEFEQAPGDSEGQGRPTRYSPWGRKSQAWLNDGTTKPLSCVRLFVAP